MDIVFSVLPIGLVLLAMIVLRRTHRDRVTTLLLQSSAAAWFVIALINRLLAGRARGMSVPGQSTPLLERLEEGSFIVFAVILFLFFRHRASEPRRKI